MVLFGKKEKMAALCSQIVARADVGFTTLADVLYALKQMAQGERGLSRAPSLEPRHERQDELGGERPAEREPDAGEGPA